MKITAARQLGCQRGPEAYFTGTVWIDEVAKAGTPSTVRVNRVSFEPGARTAWHTHPRGQSLFVVSGQGLIQLQGHPIEEIHPGDSVWIEAGEKHWHGAASGRTMSHLAIQEADAEGCHVVWMEHVTDEEYAAKN